VTGDCHARICGSPGVKLPWATRPRVCAAHDRESVTCGDVDGGCCFGLSFNTADAFQHFLWMAMLAWRIYGMADADGYYLAISIGEGYEMDSDPDGTRYHKGDQARDYMNNVSGAYAGYLWQNLTNQTAARKKFKALAWDRFRNGMLWCYDKKGGIVSCK
jgi:hypothetical protein